MKSELNSVAISEFKATCLKMLDQVNRTGTPILVTKRGKPIAMVVPPTQPVRTTTWLGTLSDSAQIKGDIISPVVDSSEWEVLKK